MKIKDFATHLRSDVAALAPPAGRMVGSVGHASARAFLVKRLFDLHLEPYAGAGSYRLPYRYGGQDFFNLVSVVPGTDPRAQPILIGAHYDSVIAAPCADDNAAAVAITLAVAERLQKQQPARDVLVAFFDAEEPPYFLMPAMGSTRFVLDQMDARGVGMALIQDLTGHDVSLALPAVGNASTPRTKDLVFMTGAESHPSLAGLVRGCLEQNDLPLVATLNENVGDLSDHHVFRSEGLPYLFFSCGRWEHYHRLSDTPEKLNYQKMARIAALLANVTLACASGDFSIIHEEADTVAFEIELLHRAFGASLPALVRLLGVSNLQNRAVLNALVGSLSGLGL